MYSSNSRVLLSATTNNLSKVVRHVQSSARTVLMTNGETRKYEEAVTTLNTLQTNAQTLEKIRSQRDRYAHLNVPNMVRFAQRAGITQADMDGLNVIHVSGTKGKGSTCAFCESILRSHGYRTGFYSSPHLVEVRERFRVNGTPLLHDSFAAYFWDVYNRLVQTKTEHDDSMPNYFAFLTVMALRVFIQERVDVAIMEVGIGGQFDCTNLVSNPVVCGVSSLGLDHTSILGHSIDKIAWHKAGIFKPGVPAVTAPQPEEAMKVLKKRAIEKGVPLSICPAIRDYLTDGRDPALGIKGSIQTVNASLALQLSHIWMQKRKEKQNQANSVCDNIPDCAKETDVEKVPYADQFPLTPAMIQGLQECQWLGRNQTIKWPGVTFYLDGAHTVESIQQCVDWFCEESQLEEKNLAKDVHRVLIFNTTGDRDTRVLLEPLKDCKFDAALFCPNIAYLAAMSAGKSPFKTIDQTNNTVTKESQLQRCMSNKNLWQQILQPTVPHLVLNGNNGTVTNGNHLDTAIGCGVTSDDNVESSAKKQKLETERHKSDCVRVNNSRYLNQTSPGQHDRKRHFQNGLGKFTAENTVFMPRQCGVALQTFPSISHCIDWVIEGRQLCDDQGTQIGDIKESAQWDDIRDTRKVTDTSNTIQLLPKGKELENFAGCEKIKSDKGEQLVQTNHMHMQVLITGSIHLVGGALRVIQGSDANC